MSEAYIVDAVRTPVGRRGGGLSGVHPADLGAHTIKALIERTGIDPGAVDDVVFGNVDSIGPQAGDIARTCWLVAGFPEHVPGTTVDRQCGSAQQAIHFAAQGVMSGTQDLVVAGGVQNMSAIPISAAMSRASSSASPIRSPGHRAGSHATATRRSTSSGAPTSSPRSGTSPARTWRSSRSSRTCVHSSARGRPVRGRDRAARRLLEDEVRASPTGRRSARCPRSSPAAASLPRCRARSATVRPRC